jgi:hypothetical protein
MIKTYLDTQSHIFFLGFLAFLIGLILILLITYFYKLYSFEKLTLKSSSNYIIIIGSIIMTIPSSYLSAVKNYGMGIILAAGIGTTSTALYMMTSHVPLDDLIRQLHDINLEADRLYSQLNTFITQFHNFVIDTGINVVTNVQGELGIDVLENLDDTIAQQYANRINVFDSLIHNHIHNLESIIKRMIELENQIRVFDESYKIQSSIYNDKLQDLIRSYGHYNDK